MPSNQTSILTRFWFVLITALIFKLIPIVNIPFNWLETFFHEFSHGIAAVLTGGQILSIKLYPNGGGLCTTAGGSRFFTAFMGYFGAVLWGALLFKVANSSKKTAHIALYTLIAMISLTAVFWVRDLLTLIICLILIGLFVAKLRFKLAPEYLQFSMQFIGMLVLLNAVLSPLHLFDGRHLGDGATLSDIAFMPEIFWVAVWSLSGIGALYLLGRKK